jgi:hypothetical protein
MRPASKLRGEFRHHLEEIADEAVVRHLGPPICSAEGADFSGKKIG